MKKLLRGMAAVAALTVVAAAMAMPSNSFLQEPANSHEQLMKQVRTNEVVMDRYERHFGMDREGVLMMFQSLRMSTLAKQGAYPVYNVPATGELRVRLLTLKAGTKVWVDGDNKPVLLAICGNPMTRSADEPVSLAEPMAMVFDSPSDDLRMLIDTEQLALGMEANVDENALYAAYIQEPAEPLSTITETTQNEATAVPTTPIVTQPVASSTGFNAGGLLLGLGAAGGILLLDDGGGSAPAPDPVPEPATMLALGAGLAMLGARKAKRK